jgi:hypothetical protein
MLDLADMPCADCGYGTISDEYYVVRNAVWERALGHKRPPDEDHVFLCIRCLEKRIGRTLSRRDFIDCRANTEADWPRSARLRNRLRRSP